MEWEGVEGMAVGQDREKACCCEHRGAPQAA
jgi:hypothetical protein